MSVANVLGYQATQNNYTGSYSVLDSAANITANLNALESLAVSSTLASIALTDSTTPTITLTAAQQTADAAALAKITSPYNLVITGGTVSAAVAATATSAVSVSDTSANVLTYLSQLQTQTAAGRITSIAFTDSTAPTLALTASQYSADTAVLGKITSAYSLSVSGVTAADASTIVGQAHVTSVVVSDTLANVLASIAALQPLAAGAELSSITLTDSSTPTLALTPAQLLADSAVLGVISSSYNLSLSADPVTGTIIKGGGGNDTLVTQVNDISGVTITGIQTLDAPGIGEITLTAAELSEFSTLTTDGVLAAAGAGTYDLTGKTLTGPVALDASQTSANVTLIADNQNGDVLVAGSGVDTLIGGSGNDTFYTGYSAPAGTTITGGSGSNTLVDYVNDISGMNITGIQTLDATGIGEITLTAAELSEFSTLTTDGDLVAAGAGTYDLTGKTLTGPVALDASQTSANVTLIADNQNGDVLVAGSGVDTLIGGSGNDTFYTGYSAPAGTTITGGSGSNTLVDYVNDISGMNITGIQTLDATGLGTVRLTAAEMSEFSTIDGGGQSLTLQAAGDGTYDLTGKTLTGSVELDASQTSANVTLIADNQNGDVLVAGSGNDTLQAGTGNDTLYGGAGTTTYGFGSSFGQDVIDNTANTSGAPQGQIDFGSGISDQNLWFQRSGNDLLVDVLGTNDQIDVSGWFGGNAAAQVQSFDANGLKLDTQVAQLVSAMASYAASNSGFNPATASSMPADSALQTTLWTCPVFVERLSVGSV